jgi:hypothetical protein
MRFPAHGFFVVNEKKRIRKTGIQEKTSGFQKLSCVRAFLIVHFLASSLPDSSICL